MAPRRLVCDAMLGSLVTVLRMAGHDVAYALDRDAEADAAVLDIARWEDRAIVTRDRELAARTEGTDLTVGLLTTREWPAQAAELADALDVDLTLDEPVRCSACNGRLRSVPDDEPRPADVPDPDERPVWRCPDCGQHFWRGSHWDDVAARLAEALG